MQAVAEGKVKWFDEQKGSGHITPEALSREKTILVVDDEPDMLWATTRILEKAGYTVLTGATAAEALSLTKMHRPSLLLLDVMLPDGNGLDVARRIKLDPDLADVFVVLLSGVQISPQEQADGLKSAQADGYAIKPLSNVDFLARIEAFLRIRSVQEALRASLSEKEVLLREVHHRVKNNLAALGGLIQMQMRDVKSSATVTVLTDLDARIRSMAIIHEMFHQSENLARIDFHDYLEKLISHVRMSFGPRSDIRFHVAAKGAEMVLADAMPCGLLVNELITNAIKHAFPATYSRSRLDGCEISVTAECDDGCYTLAVADNGVGLPADMDWMTTSTLGLHLVRMLGQHQLGGVLELDRAGGTRFVLKFKSKHRR